MNEYEFTVVLRVKVEAFDKQDAVTAVEDAFGPGETAGVEVTEFGVIDLVESQR